MHNRIFLVILSLILPRGISADDRTVPLASAGIELSEIEDRTDLTFEESQVYYGILDHVRATSPTELRAAAGEILHRRWSDFPRFGERPENEFPTFVDLIEHPQEYRGQPVTLHGHVIRLVKYPAGPNEYGIDTLYEAWLVTENSQQHPATIICTAIPPGMPIGEDVINGISVTGYFFKLHTYPSRDKKIRFAPMILAQTMSWHPPPESKVGWTNSPLVILIVLAAIASATTAVIWLSARRRRTERDQRHRESLPDEPPDFLKSLTS